MDIDMVKVVGQLKKEKVTFKYKEAKGLFRIRIHSSSVRCTPKGVEVFLNGVEAPQTDFLLYEDIFYCKGSKSQK